MGSQLITNELESTGAAVRLSVLVVTNDARRRELLRGILGCSNWELYFAEDSSEAVDVLNKRPLATVLIDEPVPEATWNELLAHMSDSPDAPRVVFIWGREHQPWLTALINRGIYGIFGPGLDPKEIRKIISHAGRGWLEETGLAVTRKARQGSDPEFSVL